MADETIIPATEAAEPPKQEGKLVSRGTPVAFNPHIPRATEEATTEPSQPDSNAPATTTQANDIPKNENGQEPVTTPPQPADDISDDTLRAFFEKQGIAYENIEKLKEKLGAASLPPTPTEEEKKQADLQREKQLLDEHISRKGTIEQFTAFKNILATDKRNLGFNKVVEDYMAEGFDQEKAIELTNQMYFQTPDNEIEEIEDEKEKAEVLKKKAAGSKKLENKG